ncbi:unnamed protein product [Spodoptera exigua]|nr:unnamed protein product [Spodoptera exigua]
MENLIKFDRDVDMRVSTHLKTARGGVRAGHVNASNAPAPRAGTYIRSSLHREEWKIYIKLSEKSTTHPQGGGARTCVRFKRAVAAPELPGTVTCARLRPRWRRMLHARRTHRTHRARRRARGGALINIYYRYFGNRGVSFGEGAEYTQLNEAGTPPSPRSLPPHSLSHALSLVLALHSSSTS